MKLLKEDPENRNWIWFKAFEKRFLVNLLRAQDFLITWRRSLRSAEFWNLSWLWTSFLLKICSLRIRFAVGEGARMMMMSWVSSHVSKRYVEKGFPECFKDGILLCALIEKLVSGACPRYDLLDPDQPLRNLKLALHLIEKHIKIKPVITAEELLQDSKLSEKKLLLLIAQMKLISEKCNLSINSPNLQKNYISPITYVSENCFARGMGLLLAVRGRKACFTIVLNSTENLDMVIEVRGPKNTACNKRITSLHSLIKNGSPDIRDIMDAQIREDILKKKIPLEYTILGRKISVNYTPLESGTHYMSIIWKGQHIMGSPYTITVDSSIEAPDIYPVPPKRGYKRLKRTDSQCYDESVDCKKENLASCPESEGTITRKRILRYIVRIDGNDVVIDGKEDLCEAINSIKRQQQVPSTVENNFESRYGIDASRFENVKAPLNATNNESSSIYDTSSERGALTNSPGDFINKIKTDIKDDSEYKETQSLKSDRNMSDRLNCKTAQKSNNNFVNRDESVELNFKKDETNLNNTDIKFNQNLDRLKINESFDHERNEIFELEEMQEKYIVNKTTELRGRKNKLKVTFSDETLLDSDSVHFSDNNINSDTKDLSPQTEDIFFPVHKVAYEVLHDDEYDTDDPYNFSQGRRTSFTELNESNYLEDDINDIEHVDNELNENYSSEIKEEDYKTIESKYEEELNDYEKVGNKCLRTKNSLFQCDHSLSFFSETVVETPPEYVSENDECENVSDNNNYSNWQNELAEMKDEPSVSDNVKSRELEECHTNRRIKLELTGRSSSLTDLYECKDSEDSDPFSFHYTDLSKLESDEFGLNQKSNLLEVSDKRKRPSWSDRDLLPCIRESSVEGLLEPDNEDDETRIRETSENISNFSENKSKPVVQNVGIYLEPCKNIIKFNEKSEIPCSVIKEFQSSSEYPATRMEKPDDLSANMETSNTLSFQTEDCRKQLLSESPNKSVFSSMNILSASPYKSRNSNNKPSEVKFSTVTNSVKSPNQIMSVNKPTTLTTFEGTSKNYILAYAAPAIIEECQISSEAPQKVPEEMRENISDNTYSVKDSPEQKSAQCLSVKKVIQIFQKEKEEPVDTWPTENGNCNIQFTFKALKDETSFVKDIHSLQTEHCLISPIGEKLHSSIKDRVKLFESEERQILSRRKHNMTEKRASSSISEKKNYWESITS